MRHTTRKTFRDYGIAILAAVAIALLIRLFIVEAYRIPTPAMRPTLEPGDTIFVLKAPLGFDRKELRRGDVVIFENPSEPGRDYIKRVLAFPGETVQVRKGRVTLNGKPLAPAAESRGSPCGREVAPLEPGKPGREYSICWEQPALEDFGPEQVPADSVFVIGDFRSQSPTDAKKRRSWGMMPMASVKGKAQWIWLSIEPGHPGLSAVRFPNLRFDRMFRRIE